MLVTIVKLVVLVLVAIAFFGLIWWSASLPDRGPGAALARKYRERGGSWGGGGWGGGGS